MPNVSSYRSLRFSLRTSGPRRVVDTWLLMYYDDLCQMASTLVRKAGTPPRQAAPRRQDAAIALVHDAYLRLRDQEPIQWLNRQHFLAWAWRAMQWIVTDQGRRQRSLKRGGSYQHIDWEDVVGTVAAEDNQNAELSEALDILRGAYPRRAAVVERRVYGGYSLHDTAEQMGISLRTAEREWRQSKVYLRRVLEADAVAA